MQLSVDIVWLLSPLYVPSFAQFSNLPVNGSPFSLRVLTIRDSTAWRRASLPIATNAAVRVFLVSPVNMWSGVAAQLRLDSKNSGVISSSANVRSGLLAWSSDRENLTIGMLAAALLSVAEIPSAL